MAFSIISNISARCTWPSNTGLDVSRCSLRLSGLKFFWPHFSAKSHVINSSRSSVFSSRPIGRFVLALDGSANTAQRGLSIRLKLFNEVICFGCERSVLWAMVFSNFSALPTFDRFSDSRLGGHLSDSKVCCHGFVAVSKSWCYAQATSCSSFTSFYNTSCVWCLKQKRKF